MGEIETHTQFLLKNLIGRKHTERLGVDKSTVLQK